MAGHGSLLQTYTPESSREELAGAVGRALNVLELEDGGGCDQEADGDELEEDFSQD